MKIVISFTDSHARDIHYFLRKKYGVKKNAKLESLVKIAVLREVAEQAKIESDEATGILVQPQLEEAQKTK